MTDASLRCWLFGHRLFVMDDYSRVQETGFFEPVRRCRRCDHREPTGLRVRNDAKWAAYHVEKIIAEQDD